MSQQDRVIDHFLAGEGCGAIFVGEMFADKTGSMARLYDVMRKFSRISRKKYGDLIYLFFKAKEDNRYSDEPEITNHDKTLKLPAVEIEKAYPEKILETIIEHLTAGKKIGAIFIDEAWAFSPTIVEIFEKLVSMDLIVILTCLNKFYDGTPIPTTGALLCLTDYTIVKQAICIPCAESGRSGKRARYSVKIKEIWSNCKDASEIPPDSKVEFGGSGVYFAACRHCFKKIYRMLEEKESPDKIIDEMGLREYFEEKGIIQPR